jgi:valyl-tRNA synthetase
MPFITEELWTVTAEQGPKRANLLALSDWPKLEGLADEKAEAEIGWFVDLVTAIRSVRAEMNIPGGALLRLEMVNPSKETFEKARHWDAALNRLARIEGTANVTAASKGSIQLVVRNETFALPLFGVIDVGGERARLEKEMAKVDADVARSDAKLNNPKFVERAAEEVVDEEREKREEALARKAKIAEALERLKGAE